MLIFTNDDYRRIQAWLKKNAIKDSDFAISQETVPEEDILVITLNMATVPTNYKIKIKDLLNSSLGKVVINSIIAKSVKVNNLLTVDASNIKLDNKKGVTLQNVLDYFDDNKLNRHTDDTIDGNLTIKKNITIEGNIKSNDGTTTVEADLKATGEITDGDGNILSDVNDAAKQWSLEYQDPQQDEPTVRAKYVLKDYKGVQKGDAIKVYKDSAITNVYLGTTEDTCNENTGEVTKKPVQNNNEALSIVYRLDTGKYSLVNIPIGIFIKEAEFDKYRGLGITENGQVFIKLANDVESSNYLHFNDSGEISADGIENRILQDLGTIINSVAGDSTMWGQYKKEEGTKDSPTSEASRWGQYKQAEASRNERLNNLENKIEEEKAAIIGTDRIANGAVTIPKLSTDIQALIANLSKNALFAGIATPTTNPGTPNGPVFYIATEAGTYANFNGISVSDGEVVILECKGSWVKKVTGFASQQSINEIINNVVTIDFTYDGKYINKFNGNEGTHSILSCTDFIEIDGLSLSFNCFVFGDACGIALYDENKKFVVSYGISENINDVTIITSIEIPKNVKYARFTTATSKKDNSKLKIDGHFINKRLFPINSYLNQVANITDNEISLPKELLVINDRYFDVNGNIKVYRESEIGYTITETFIRVKAQQEYSLINYLSYGYVVFYTYDKVYINTVAETSALKSELNFTTPENCYYIRVTFNRNVKDKPIIINRGVLYPIYESDGDAKPNSNLLPSKLWLHSYIGGLVYNTFKNKGYSHIIYYGQSLSDGHVSRQPISTEAVEGCYMLGQSVRDFADNLQPLVSTINGNTGEPPVVGCVNSLKNLFNNTSFLNELKLIGTSCGVGGYTIEQLSKNKQVSQGENVYHTRFLKALNNSKIAVGEEPIECSAIVYMQGEANQDKNGYSGTGIGINDIQTHDKDEYKTLLKKLKEDMQADIMEIYGQKKPPLFFIYQTSVFYSPIQDMPITMAQYEFAQENDDVILLNPHYYCTTAENGGGHLNANGYRWYGEQTAKTIYEVFIKNINFNPIIPKEFVIKKNVLYIYCYVPNPPIVIDTYTAIEVKNYGFNIFKDDVVVGINSVKILNDNIIAITTDTDLSSGKIDLSYAGKEQQGRGNIRDSDSWYSFTNYVDDTSLEQNMPPYTPINDNGENYYGKRYPMYNWLSNLYMTISDQ